MKAITARSLTRRAEVNLATVSYYFGGIEDLLIHVFNENFDKFSQCTASMLENVAATGTPGRIEEIVDALVRSLWQAPVHISHGRGSQIIDEIFGYFSEGARQTAVSRLETSLDTLVALLLPLLPHLDHDALLLRLTCIGGAVRSMVPRTPNWEIFHALASAESRREERVIGGVIAFAIASLRLCCRGGLARPCQSADK